MSDPNNFRQALIASRNGFVNVFLFLTNRLRCLRNACSRTRCVLERNGNAAQNADVAFQERRTQNAGKNAEPSPPERNWKAAASFSIRAVLSCVPERGVF